MYAHIRAREQWLVFMNVGLWVTEGASSMWAPRISHTWIGLTVTTKGSAIVVWFEWYSSLKWDICAWVGYVRVSWWWWVFVISCTCIIILSNIVFHHFVRKQTFVSLENLLTNTKFSPKQLKMSKLFVRPCSLVHLDKPYLLVQHFYMHTIT